MGERVGGGEKRGRGWGEKRGVDYGGRGGNTVPPSTLGLTLHTP